MADDRRILAARDIARAPVHRVGEIFSLIHRGEARTISELCDATGLARSTVGTRIARLLDLGLIAAASASPVGKGRAPSLYTFNPAAGIILAAQVGITASRAALTDLEGDIIDSVMVDTRVDLGAEPVLAALGNAFEALLAGNDTRTGRLHGIGIGLPNVIELTRLNTESSDEEPGAMSDWSELVSTTLTKRFSAPAFVDQDVNLLALAEQRVHWPDSRALICVKAGTVLSAGVLIHGSVVKGREGLTGEIGHTTVQSGGGLCNCGNRGCLNVVAGGKALAENLRAEGHAAGTARDVARLAQQGLPEAIEQVRNSGRRIGEVLAGAVNLLNPDVITVWGYLAEPEEHLFAGLRESLFSHALPRASDAVKLVPARLGNDAGIKGASMIVVEHSLSEQAVEAQVEAANS
ncbi:sugar kinase [Microbacterium faecale]|uniref:Sugar kinase n=1 Tax=Microbacterium faecale TaxID=1804630 RepID=A0A916Y5H0_9MICO|nr:ROK family transcriptional regulator [Microbacterium faecale]GGD31576.1 sugar kinase [Microbacterium faecale]